MAQTTKTKPAEATKAQIPATTSTPAQPNTATKQAAASIFAKIKDKVTHVTPEQVDAWQKSWLKMPETRKKYEHLQDVPQVVGEELMAMSNDIIDYLQKQPGGKSEVFQKVKNFFNNPFDFLKPKAPVATTPQAPAAVVQAPPAPIAQAKTTHTKAKKTAKK